MADRSAINGLSESIVKALLYYDLFDHPLTSDEVYRNLPTNHVSTKDVDKELASLVDQSVIFKLGTFYSLQSNPALESRRVNGGLLAAKRLVIAERKAKLIARFPFVQSVMISGSLSKGVASEASDIDFFVVTTVGRLWIVRTLLALYRRVFLFNSCKYFCVNYFIDEDHLEIEEKNRFTATELTTLIPMCGTRLHRELINRNEWIQDFFPHFKLKAEPKEKDIRTPFKKATEWIINRLLPDKIDQFLMRLAMRRWSKLYSPLLEPSEFELAFKTRRYVSKGHPKAYQNKVINRYEQRIRDFAKSFSKH